MTSSPDLIEQIARAMHERAEQLDPSGDENWETMPERSRAFWRLVAHAALSVIIGTAHDPD